ncbi:MAG: hypothetical protein ACK4L4_19830, partial [Gemmobacter sp.]
ADLVTMQGKAPVTAPVTTPLATPLATGPATARPARPAAPRAGQGMAEDGASAELLTELPHFISDRIKAKLQTLVARVPVD